MKEASNIAAAAAAETSKMNFESAQALGFCMHESMSPPSGYFGRGRLRLPRSVRVFADLLIEDSCGRERDQCQSVEGHTKSNPRGPGAHARLFFNAFAPGRSALGLV